MAVKLATSSDYLRRTTNVVQPSSNYTCIFWLNSGAISTNPAYQTAFLAVDDPSVYAYYAGVFLENLNLYFSTSDSSTFSTINGSAPVVNTWYPVAYTRSGNVHSFYVNGILVGTTTLNISAGTFGYLLLGNDTFSDGNINLYNFREWNVALTLAQINAEIASFSSVVHTSNLVTYTPLTSDLLDVSGNGNNWTAVGSPTFVVNPTLPTNFTPTNAISISSLPYSNTQNVFDGTTAYTVWYKYTTVSGDNVLGPFAFGAIGGYAPICNILESDLSDFIVSANLPNAAMLLPSEANGTTYYFQIVPNVQGLSSASLTFSLVRHVDVTAPIGTVAISSDFDTDNNYDLPLALLNPNADGVLAFVNPFTVGEQGNILASGVLAVSDDDESSGTGHNIVIYNTSYAKTSTTALGAVCLNITSDAGQTTFYFLIKSGSNYDVKAISTGGTIGGTTYNLGTTAVHNIAVDPTNAYIYYQLTTSNTIKKWVIGTNSAGADLVTGISAFPIQDLLCLTDGSIIAADAGGTARRYDSSGTLLNTYSVGTINAKARMCAGTDATYFVIYLTFVGNTVPLPVLQIRCSDGVILNNQTYSTFEQGNNQMAVSATPVRFGPSQSCPVWVTRTALTFTNSTIVVGKASNPLAIGVTFMVNGPAGMFSIMTDTSPGQIINVAPGTYSVVEVSNTQYNPSYFVSNDPVNNNNTAIVVGTSELVDVVILNTLSQKYGGLYTLVPGKQQDTLRNQDGSTVLKMINWFFELFTDRDK